MTVDVEETSLPRAIALRVLTSAIMEVLLLGIAVLVDPDTTASSLSLALELGTTVVSVAIGCPMVPLVIASLPFVRAAVDATAAETDLE